MTENESQFVLNWAKRIKDINYLGGKCSNCGISDPFVLTFHHNKGKEFQIQSQIRWSILEEELKKCIALCSNCHCEEHRKISRNGNAKEKLLKKLNITKCSICGYSGKNYASLLFHHTEKENKKFIINDFITRKKKITIEDFLEELTKCIVICSNCHKKLHVNVNKFEKLKVEIYNKVDSYKEESIPLNEEKIRKMMESGMKQSEICAELNVVKSTIGTIVKRLRDRKLIPEATKIDSNSICAFCKNKFVKTKKHVKFCSKKCANESRSKKPEKEVLKSLLSQMSMAKVGEKFGVSRISVWNWCKSYEI
jgi:transposase